MKRARFSLPLPLVLKLQNAFYLSFYLRQSCVELLTHAFSTLQDQELLIHGVEVVSPCWHDVDLAPDVERYRGSQVPNERVSNWHSTVFSSSPCKSLTLIPGKTGAGRGAEEAKREQGP